MHPKSDDGGSIWVDPDDAPELTDAFFETAEIRVGGKMVRRGRPPTGRTKTLVSLRLDADVVSGLRALGPGWQTRANAALPRFVEQGGGTS